MSRVDCERWIALSDRVASGEELEASDRRFLEGHVASCGSCAAEAEVWGALGNVLHAPTYLMEPLLFSAAASRRRRPRAERRAAPALRWPPLAAAAAVALALGSWLVARSEVVSERLSTVTDPVPASLVLTSGEVELAGAREVLAGTTLRSGDVIRVRQGQACLTWDTAWVCLDSASELRLQAGAEQKQVLSLRSGVLVARVEKRQPGREFVVETPRGSVTVKGTVFAVAVQEDGSTRVRVQQGAVLVQAPGGRQQLVSAARELALDDTWQESAADPELLARDAEWIRATAFLGGDEACSLEVDSIPGGASVRVDGQALGRAPLTVKVPCGSHQVAVSQQGFVEDVRQVVLVREPVKLMATGATASETTASAATAKARPAELGPAALLARSREQRSAGRYQEAAAAYRKLVAQHSASPEAGPALVSLGELELSQLGAPASALRSFDAYLKRGGALAPEAHYGRIRALRQLGRHAEAEEAITRFLAAYPTSVQAAQLRATQSARQPAGQP